MKNATAPDTITDEQIAGLAQEAANACDDEQVKICRCALNGSKADRAECARVIAEARAQAAKTEAALNTIKEASNGLIVQYGGGCIYQPAEIEAWVWVDGAELDQLGAAILAGEEDAYSLWAAQCGETLWTSRGAWSEQV